MEQCFCRSFLSISHMQQLSLQTLSCINLHMYSLSKYPRNFVFSFEGEKLVFKVLSDVLQRYFFYFYYTTWTATYLELWVLVFWLEFTDSKKTLLEIKVTFIFVSCWCAIFREAKVFDWNDERSGEKVCTNLTLYREFSDLQKNFMCISSD